MSTPGAPGAWRGRAHAVGDAHWPRATQGPGTTDSWERGAEGPAGLRDMGGLVATLLHTRGVGARATGQPEQGILNKPTMGEWEGLSPALGAAAPQGPPAPEGRPAEKNGPSPCLRAEGPL